MPEFLEVVQCSGIDMVAAWIAGLGLAAAFAASSATMSFSCLSGQPLSILVAVTPGDCPSSCVGARTPLAPDRRKTRIVEPTKLLPKPATVNRQIIEPARRLTRYVKPTCKLPIDLDEFKWVS